MAMSDPEADDPRLEPPRDERAPGHLISPPEGVPYQAAGRPLRRWYLTFFLGLTALACGLVWRWVEKGTGVVTDVWIFVSLLAVLTPLAWHASDVGRAAGSRRGAAFGFVTLTLGLGFVVAVFVGWADVKYKSQLWAADLTKSARYSLSEESKRVLDKVDGTVYATYLTQAGTDPGLRAKTIEQLRTYESASSHVHVAEVDALRNPDAAARTLREQGVTSATSSGEDTDVIVFTYAEPGKDVAPDKQKEIKVEPWTFSKMSSTDERKWLGESVITSAIYELVFQKYRAYVTGGHGERPLAQDFRELTGAMKTQNIDVESTPLLLSAKPQIPEDCEILLVLGATAPFTPDEAAIVSRWLDKGKTLFLAVDVQSDRTPTGLEPILDGFGVHTRLNYVVGAPQLQRVKINDREMLAPAGFGFAFAVQGQAYADHPATRALRARSGLATFFFKSTFIDIDPKPPEGADPQPVCFAPEAGEFTPIGYRNDPGRTNFAEPDDTKDKSTGKLPLIVTSTRKAKDAAGGESRLVLSGDTDVFSDRVIADHSPNLDLARGLVQWGLKREGLVSVSDRTLEDPFITPTEYQRRFALGWPALVCLLPLIAGGMVWWARRR
jgi:hypothetical protein